LVRVSDARLFFFTRGIRGFADGAVSVLLAGYLVHLGYNAFEVGTIVTSTLFGSAVLTLAVGLLGHRFERRRILFFAAALMLATGLGFYEARAFWPLVIISAAGTLNPSAGDVSVFLPAEQAALSETVESTALTRTFAKYNLSGGVMGAVGALASGIPFVAEREWFLVYAIGAVFTFLAYLALSKRIEGDRGAAPRAPLEKSRSIVIRLSLLFSLDAFGGGFIVQSMLVLWLGRRFSLAPEELGAVFFASSLLGAFSQLVSSRLADRFGRINTMVYTHLPSNAFLIAAALAPTGPWAIAFLLLRASLSSMDVPARQSYVMAVVPSEERAAASSVTNVPRSLASAIAPLLAGILLEQSTFGWPLIAAGVLKAIYDLLLLAQFRETERAT
jgi:MFS family permease